MGGSMGWGGDPGASAVQNFFVTSINQGEPDAQLFHPPAGYRMGQYGWATGTGALENGCGLKVFEPESQIELASDEISGGDEAEDCVLEFVGEFGEGVAGAGAGHSVEFVEAKLVVKGDWER